jgi:hypothetical protein
VRRSFLRPSAPMVGTASVWQFWTDGSLSTCRKTSPSEIQVMEDLMSALQTALAAATDA